MIQLDERERQVLKWIAMHPNDYAGWMRELRPEVQDIVMCLVGRALGPVEAFETARSLGIWATYKHRQLGPSSNSADKDAAARMMERWTR